MPPRLASFLARVPPVAETDAELLARFARHRDQEAFTALVGRHGSMVLGACHRALGDAHAAEDAFQAAFLVLARKAATLPRPEALAGWLYGVARRVALDSRTVAPIPLPAEETVGRHLDPLAELTGREVLAVLEEEVDRLPADYRLPVVLCCLEGLALEEAAVRLECSTGALRGRLERGRTRLRERLARRGLVPVAVLAVGSIPRFAPAAIVTSDLRGATTRAALNFVSRTGTVPDGPRRLAERVLHTMFTTKIKLWCAVLLAAVLVVPVLFAGHKPVGKPLADDEKSAGTGAMPELPREGTTVTGRVVSEPDGKVVVGTLVTLWDGSGLGRWTARTDETGFYSFTGVKPGDYYKVWIEERANKQLGCWSEGVVVRVADRPVRADDLFVELPQSLSGTVIDVDSEKPVPGAEINFSTADGNRDSIKTDSAGQFRLFVTPREIDLYCNGTRDRYGASVRRLKVTVGAGKHVKGTDFKLRSAPPFAGRIVLPDGKPARGADVLVEVRWTPLLPAGGFGSVGTGKEFRFKSDDEGRFRGYMVGTLAEGGARTVELKVLARTPDHTLGGVVEAKTGAYFEYWLDPLKVVLAKSSGVMVRVINPDGKPLTDAKVIASNYPGWDTGWGGPVKHVGEGKYLIMGLVPGLEYHLSVQAAGYQTGSHANKLVLKPDETRDVGDVRLEWWGKKAVPGLIKKLQSADMYERETAIRMLWELGADAADAVPALVEKLNQDPRNTVRFGVATTLGKIGPAAKAAVPDLIRALREDTGGGVQREAAMALGLIGDVSALPALKDALKNSESDVPRAASEAIKRLEEAAKKPRPAK